MASTPNEGTQADQWSLTPPAPQSTLNFPAPDPLASAAIFHGMAGRSPSMRRLFDQMDRIAPQITLATIEGEEGTGKTLAARALHAAGATANKRFVPCLASLFFAESASTDTTDWSKTDWSTEILDQASSGMLYLDRVHDLTSGQQTRLANFLIWFDDQQTIGAQLAADGDATRSLPRQIVFSSCVSLRRLISTAGMRHDLVSRLSAIRLLLPALHERREDIPLLAQLFIQRFARAYGKPVRGLGPGTIAPLLRHSWPGNVRELESVITSAALETESQWIRPIDLPFLAPRSLNPHDASSPQSETSAAADPASELNLDRAIHHHVARTLRLTRGNKLRAAQLLGISRSTLYRILAGTGHSDGPGSREQARGAGTRVQALDGAQGMV